MLTDELDRHNAARQRFVSNTADRETHDRIYGSGLVLVVAIAQVLGFAQRVHKSTDDADLAQARERFDASHSRAKAIRDVGGLPVLARADQRRP